MKSNNDRVREENEAYKQQNAKLLQEIKESKTPEEEFNINQNNKNAVEDPEFSNEFLNKKVEEVQESMANAKTDYLKEEKQRSHLLQ
jgi:hypothetical protein